ncbi:MAG: hypothetical protein WCG79_00100 [Verrucomicrobiota bacterium]|jgi:hypothetical protein
MPLTTPNDRSRASATDVFRDYGIGSLFLIVWEIWCIRDGWFNPGYDHIPFSRAMAWISAPILVFCLVMAISAGLTLQKEKRKKPPAGN